MFCCSYSLEEVRKRLDKMGLKKARGPDDLPMEAIRILASYNMDLLTETRTL